MLLLVTTFTVTADESKDQRKHYQNKWSEFKSLQRKHSKMLKGHVKATSKKLTEEID